jgi:hypothetical protein
MEKRIWKMLVVFPFCQKDSVQMLALVQWIALLGACPKHNALLVVDPETQWSEVLAVKKVCEGVFSRCDLMMTEKSVSGWPEAANYMFKSAAGIIESNFKQAWYWCESDNIPMCSGWLDALESEYVKFNKPFMGAFVRTSQPGLPSVSMAGCAVYPPDAASRIGICCEGSRAWDVVSAGVVVPLAANTDLIQHFFGQMDLPPTFSEIRNEFSPVNLFTHKHLSSKAVVFHRNKDGTLIQLLRRKLFPEKNPQQEFYDAFIQLGRYGDLILLLPAWREMHQRTGRKPIVVCSYQYCTVLEGVSYVDKSILSVDWWMGIPEAIKRAKGHRWSFVVTQCYGREWGVNLKQWPNFMSSMWDQAGLLSELKTLPLIFDNRDTSGKRRCGPDT